MPCTATQHKTLDDLVAKSKLLLKEFESENDEQRRTTILEELERIRQTFQRLCAEDSPGPGSFVPYPSLDDPNFQAKLANKTEFARHTAERQKQGTCDQKSSFFELTSSQRLLKTFMSPKTPYRSLLLYHGVGVGKTCTAISIAEQFKNPKKKIIVLLPSQLKASFQNQLFDVHKLSDEQCTGNTYVDQIPDKGLLSAEALERRANRLIQRHYEFYGFLEFANRIERIRKNLSRLSDDPKKVDRMWNERIATMFSDRLFIIDEVHNLRIESEKTKKVVPPILERVMRYGRNNRLILLSATPMFNDAREITFIVNLLLLNDKRTKALLQTDALFSQRTNQITKAGERILANALRGYVSYMRSENPYTFPTRLAPQASAKLLAKGNVPTTDIKGRKLTEKQRLQLRTEDKPGFTLVESRMSEAQYLAYASHMNETATKPATSVVIAAATAPAAAAADANGDGETALAAGEDDTMAASLQHMIQVSNIAYPAVPTTSGGKESFLTCFEVLSGQNKPLKVRYKTAEKFLQGSSLETVAPKLNTILNAIKSSKGIVYVYSNYIYSGLLPLAIALEHAGFQNASKNNILSAPSAPAAPRLGNYAILSGDKSLTANFQEDVERIRSAKNANGELVKVILGTSVSSEGIDFKCIREIHILEPWYHLNKMEQVIGRAVRHCSHERLPVPDRNVTIYHHVNVLPKAHALRESIDLRIYRMAQQKQESIRRIERVLRNNSIDCLLNRALLTYGSDEARLKADMVTSQGIKLKDWPLTSDDQDPDAFSVECVSKLKVAANQPLDASTFDSYFIRDEIERYVRFIQHRLLQTNEEPKTFQQWSDALKELYPSGMDEDMLKYALHSLVQSRRLLMGKDGLQGYILYRSNKYLFQSTNIASKHMSLKERHPDARRPVRIVIGESALDSPITEKDDPDQPLSIKPPTNWTSEKELLELLESLNAQRKTIEALLPAGRKDTKAFADAVHQQVVDHLSDMDWLHLCIAMRIAHVKRFADSPWRMSVADPLICVQERYLYSPHRHMYLRWSADDGGLDEQVTPLEFQKYIRPTLEAAANVAGNGKLMGFVDISAKTKNQPEFKVVGDQPRASGSICWQTTKVEQILTLIQSMDPEIAEHIKASKNVQKRQFCVIAELLLRIVHPDRFKRPYIKAIELLNRNKN